METKASFRFLPVERNMAVEAMCAYRDKLKGWALKQFDIAYNKMKESSNGVIKFDGMELEYLKRALNFRGWQFYQERRKIKADTYFTLAFWIKEQKRIFQDNNNPLKQKNTAT
ncbi:hypothetical protein [Guptibacillus hwajinpoensis]|uniref:Uncharacterized protein n=1 Tax=Guptibacillus hwajinpoensis TaxID=208199 RepID=A0A0J6D2W0_9BACL|nr:hypothetical protein [Alkalihalobacillus macyae]KMM38614.1 hypothetical protein AB986_04885 [Alkalihalobacillus macyae]